MQNVIEVMRVLRVPPMGKLIVEVNKKRYQNLSEIEKGNVRRLLLAAVGELVDFAGGYGNLVEAGVASPMATSSPSGTATSPDLSDLEQQQAEFLARLEEERDKLQKTQPHKPTFSVLSGLQPTIENDTVIPPKDEKKLSIVEQIDAILQKYVSADPNLANRSIHLEQEPAGGLRIVVDGNYYRRPREIEEQEIQILIKQALKEWESS